MRGFLLLLLLAWLSVPALALPKDLELQGIWTLDKLRWTSGGGPPMQVRLELALDGTVSFESWEIRRGFAETTAGECVTFTSRDREQRLEGSYELTDQSLVLHWKDRGRSGLVSAHEGTEAWPYRFRDGRLELTFADRVLILTREPDPGSRS